MSEVILKVKNLSVILDGEKVIEDLSFEMKKRNVITILGPNGAGKTVLLKTLLGIYPYQGEIKWKENIKIGYVPQRVPLAKDIPITIEDFFKLKRKNKDEIKKALGLAGIDTKYLNKKIGNLSSGQFQRILIAWALMGNPDVLLFDEPTAGVDIRGEDTIYNLLSNLKEKENLTMLWVTHDLSVVFKFSDLVLCLNKCPICKGQPKEVLTPQILFKIYGQEVKFYEHHKH